MPSANQSTKPSSRGSRYETFRKRASISCPALFRHKDHVAATIAKAQERREEKLGDTIFDEMKRRLSKVWELLSKMEAEGNHRDSIVALAASERGEDVLRLGKQRRRKGG